MDIGYEWKRADRRKPNYGEVVKFRKIGDTSAEGFGMWAHDNYYVYDILDDTWKLLIGFKKDYEYAYIPKNLTAYIPFYAIANSKRHDILG